MKIQPICKLTGWLESYGLRIFYVFSLNSAVQQCDAIFKLRFD